MIGLKKDKKGPCWILSHQRCGITESIFITEEELYELCKILKCVRWSIHWPDAEKEIERYEEAIKRERVLR